jgi:molybdopterin converting factor small subunit
MLNNADVADMVEMASSKMPAGHFKILYFAAASAYTQKNDEALAAPLNSTELFQALEARYPGITAKVLASCAVTVNLDYVDADEKGVVIQEGDEVAIIPPVSGG